MTELAECTGLENRRRETDRGFESLPLRHINKKGPTCFQEGPFLFMRGGRTRTRGRLRKIRRERIFMNEANRTGRARYKEVTRIPLSNNIMLEA